MDDDHAILIGGIVFSVAIILLNCVFFIMTGLITKLVFRIINKT